MKKFKKIKFSKYFILLIFLFILFIAMSVHTTIAAEEVSFDLTAENVTTENGQIHRVTFILTKGTDAEPVSLTTSIKYDRAVFEEVQPSDIKPCENLVNKTISTSCDFNVFRVVVGLENYNTEPLPNGEIFTCDLKVLEGATINEDSVAFNTDETFGLNQASTRDAQLLKLVDGTEDTDNNTSDEVNNDTAAADESSNVVPNSCFIDSLFKP